MSSSETVLSVKNVSKCYEMYDKPAHRLLQTLTMGRKNFYKEFWALRDINLEVKRGECLGIIGRNGAGKSTLLQIITGTLAPSSGYVETNARIAALLELGSGFNPDYTGRENIFMSASILGLSKQEIVDRYDEIIAFADIGEFIDQPVKTYSSGMMVRLAFAVNVHVNADLLIIDEALSVGDIFFQQKCVDFINDKLKNKTKLMVSHDLQMLTNFADKIAIIDNGLLSFEGKPREALKVYTQLKQGVLPGQKTYGGTHDEIQLEPVNPANLSGKGNFVITAYAINSSIVSPGDNFKVIFSFTAKRIFPVPGIIGYFFRDRTGKQVFGSNTDVQNIEVKINKTGNYTVCFDFEWPSIIPGEYTLTLGIGSGSTTNQEIQCWVQDISKVTCINENADYSIYTHKLRNLHMEHI
ncbi:ABC transporter ATP-binding protein [Lentisphaerota bacterium ZTH]|nr:ABC transporter ATP-binding protein [Lentisphaerota bacterium]WET06400.1 ABC transporter ATP-binding protein [Lentisphaerota bacterium ZTH]